MHAFFSKKVKFLDYYSTEGRDFVIKQENNFKDRHSEDKHNCSYSRI